MCRVRFAVVFWLAAGGLFPAGSYGGGEAGRGNQSSEKEQGAKRPSILLFADAPTREYEFVRNLLLGEQSAQRVDLSIYLQSAKGSTATQGVSPERMLQTFPHRFQPDQLEFPIFLSNLDYYDVIIAFDPHWKELKKESLILLEKWLAAKGALVVIGGPVHGYELGKDADREHLQPLLDVLPVVIGQEQAHATTLAWKLNFHNVADEHAFLKLDDKGSNRLAGWKDFFIDTNDEKRVQFQNSGFYSFLAVKEIKKTATLLATVSAKRSDGSEQPYLATMPYGKGRAVFIGSGETWRLRQHRPDFHAAFWLKLIDYLAGSKTWPGQKDEPNSVPWTKGEIEAINKGLDFLSKTQHADGHWQNKDGYDAVALTALAGMAFLMEGSTPTEGQYASQLRKAVDWLLARSQEDGAIRVPTEIVKPLNRPRAYMNAHGYALMFLSCAYGDENDIDRLRKFRKIIERATEFSATAQLKNGGWGYFASGGENTTCFAMQVQALRAARNAGIPVPKQTINKAIAYLKECTRADGGITNSPGDGVAFANLAPAAVASNFALEQYQSDVVKKQLNFCQRNTMWRKLKETDADLHYYISQVHYLLAEKGYATIFEGVSKKKPEDCLRWSDYRRNVFDQLVGSQKPDGSWFDGNVEVTARYLAALQLERAALPFYQR